MSYLISKDKLSRAIEKIEPDKGKFVLTSADIQEDARSIAGYFFEDCLGADALQMSNSHKDAEKPSVIEGEMTPQGSTDALAATVIFDTDGAGDCTGMTVRLALETWEPDMFCGPLRLTLEGVQELGLAKPNMVFQLRPGTSGIVFDAYGEVTFPLLQNMKFRLRPSQDGLFIEEISAPLKESLADLSQLAKDLPGFKGLSAPSEGVGEAIKAVFSTLGSLTLTEAGVSLSTSLENSGGFKLTPAAAWLRISLTQSVFLIPGVKLDQANLELIYKPGETHALRAVLTGKFTILNVALTGTISLPDLTFQAEATVPLPTDFKSQVPDILPLPTTQVRVRVIGNVKAGQYALICDLTNSQPVQLVPSLLTLKSPTLKLSRIPSSNTWDASLYGVLELKHENQTLDLELRAEKLGDSWLFDADLRTDWTLNTALKIFGAPEISWLDDAKISQLAVHVERNQGKTTGSVFLQGAAGFGSVRIGMVVAVALGGAASVRATLTIGLESASAYRTMTFGLVAENQKFQGTWEADPPIGPSDIVQALAGKLPDDLADLLSMLPFHILSVTLTVDSAARVKSLTAKTKENTAFAFVLV
ncbi:hypothetical protein LKL35_37130 [Streptomyces sp. ET3-23]|uniref:hypothetical protein n=1 Tax=Streptomyces sp. ET3-23 TaxID=2885643 RepID=UPI001D111299|nr:hypothetical protein [Streptomyces sp. ET3-23]MCC2280943.1 hypothetical protein [Streptomyces sp. ET3-23]